MHSLRQFPTQGQSNCNRVQSAPFPNRSTKWHNWGKPRGPVLEKHPRIRGCGPHLKAGFCHAHFFGDGAPLCAVLYGFGRDGHLRKDCRTAYPVFFTSRPPNVMKTQKVVYLSRYGVKTMSIKPITTPEALAHLTSAKAKLQKAISALNNDVITSDHLHSAIGQVLSAGRSLKRAAEADKPSQSQKQEG